MYDFICYAVLPALSLTNHRYFFFDETIILMKSCCCCYCCCVHHYFLWSIFIYFYFWEEQEEWEGERVVDWLREPIIVCQTVTFHIALGVRGMNEIRELSWAFQFASVPLRIACKKVVYLLLFRPSFQLDGWRMNEGKGNWSLSPEFLFGPISILALEWIQSDVL